MINTIGMIVSACLAIYGIYLMFTCVDAVWGDECPHCGYSYRGLPHTSSQCPECGETIDRETQGYIERRPARLVLGVLLLIGASAAFVGSIFLRSWP